MENEEKNNSQESNIQYKDNQEAHLTRAQRKKLKREQFKEEKRREQQLKAKSSLYKKLGFGIVGVVIIVIIGYFIFSGSKTVTPTADSDPILGSPNAPLTIIEFGDFKCPFTRQFNMEIMKDLFEEYKDQIKIVYKDMPTGKHGDSVTPAMAAECANEQGKFREYHDLLFQNQHFSSKSDYKGLALRLGLDTAQFNECFDSGKYKSEVKDDYKEGKKAKVALTPTLFINGVTIQGVVDDSVYRQVINEQLSRLI